MNHKRMWRLYKLANLSVRKRPKVKRPTGERQPLAARQHVNDTWSADFVREALADGRCIKCLTVVDDFSRECVDIAVVRARIAQAGAATRAAAAQFDGKVLTALREAETTLDAYARALDRHTTHAVAREHSETVAR